MSKRSREEYRQNATNRRGIVVDRDPRKMRIKVRFEDEDDVVTHWIDVTGPSARGHSFFSMPGMDDEVWCAMDAKGEGGCLLGSRYNDKDAPPHQTNEDIAVTFAGGFVHIDTASGAISIQAGGTVTIKAGAIALESASLTHNGVNIGSTHGHVSAPPGPPGPPV